MEITFTMPLRNSISLLLVIVVFTSLFVAPQSIKAEEEFDDDMAWLEEVIVTATKRDEMISDVPISMTVLDSEDIATFNIKQFQDGTAYIPNFSVTRDPIGDKINIRGIQSGNQAGFEQSVGTFVDGIYRGRGVQVRFMFLDVGAIEVLRGTQGTLFGKNTIGGALNIITAKPTEELTAEISGGYNLDFEETDVKGVISGAFSDTVRGRFAFLDRQRDKGWIENLAYDEDNPSIDESAFRGILEWDTGEDTLLTLRYEQGEWDNVGEPWVINEQGALAAFSVPGLADGLDQTTTNMGNTVTLIEAIAGPGAGGDVTPIDYGNSALFAGELEELGLTLDHEFSDGSTLTAILGYSTYDFERAVDADFNPLPVLAFIDNEDYEQSSFEIRWASDYDQVLEFITGLYYQQNDMLLEGLTSFNATTLNVLTASNCLANGGSIVAGDPNATIGANFGTTSAAVANACVQNALLQSLTGLSGLNRYNYLDQDTETWAVFGQLTWNITDELRAALGLRYTQEEKDATQGVRAANYIRDNTAATTNASVIAATQLFGESTLHDINLGRDEESVTWSSTIQWDIDPSTMLYAVASTGFKAGGFNSIYMGATNGGGTNAKEAEFDDEEVKSAELGAKMLIADGVAELNISYFYIDYNDLQVSVFTGSTSFVVQNAAEATSQGIEIDGRWQLSKKLILQAALGWIDFEFGSFPNQACTSSQFLAYRESVWATDPAAAMLSPGDCAAAGINNLKGERTENTPEYAASLVAVYTQHFADYELISALAVNYTDDVDRQGDLDPVEKDDAFTKVDLSVQFGPEEGRWDVSLIGKNLTDKTTRSWGNDMPLFPGSHMSYIDEPRNITLQGRFRF